MSSISPTKFRTALINWYAKNKRSLPWRYNHPTESPDPYKIWLSEIMLQQTVVKAVIPYFKKFTKQWPTVESLARATQEEVTDEWAGLGYYSRARNLHKCAQTIASEYNSVFPNIEKELLKLSGIGEYTAAAISSIAYNKPANIIDGNVERVMARVFAIRTPLRDSKKQIKELAAQFIDAHEGNHHDYSQSLMELGATICRPKSPKCTQCPIAQFCLSLKNNIQCEIPTKPIKKKKVVRFGYAYIVNDDKGRVLVERRGEKGLLANTIGLPTSNWEEDKNNCKQLQAIDHGKTIYAGTVNHVFTHLHLYLDVYKSSEPIKVNSNTFYWLEEDKLKSRLPTLFQKVYDIDHETK